MNMLHVCVVVAMLCLFNLSADSNNMLLSFHVSCVHCYVNCVYVSCTCHVSLFFKYRVMSVYG